MGMLQAAAAGVLLFAFGCKGNKAEDKPVAAGGSAQAAGGDAAAGSAAGSATASAAGATAAGATAAGSASEAAPRQLAAPPPAKLLDKPVERRLYSDRIEASSFLWTDWNKFQENYHPNYILDGDPKTAWVEGADGSGTGEWVRIHVSPVEGVTKIRLRIRNGYHKSKELYGKNARLAKVELVALPSNAKQTVELKDAMEWQEVAFEQPAGKLEAIELRAVSVVEGSKYTDLCVSDLEIYATGLTAENPAFEKAKLAELLAWKKKRLDAAKLLGGAGAATLPVLPGYRVIDGDKVAFEAPRDGKEFSALRAAIAALAKHASTVPAYADAAKRATAGLESKFAGWSKVQVVAKHPLDVPDVDGLVTADGEELVWGGPEDAFLMPSSDQGVLLASSHLSAFDTKGKNPMDDTDCKEGTSQFMRGPKLAADGPVIRELLHIRCVSEETREGKATYMTWQLLEFDPQGNLVLTAGPHEQVQWFEWKQGERSSVLAGGGRVRDDGEPLQRLVVAKAARP